ncbi:hypothetical protein LSTR_LSTR010759 [Laodelphax striatellus]|uniref:Peptidoglycan binding-like domain-containing protein n=1 Tax=Laodelphax striatellus TaxID=195883 RepID=A0A482WQ34_LAOST|nr:hypothetical protein LSTR_LSTR010759 [Laodelphax striatellus]
MTSFRQRSDSFASLPSQPVGREMCHACFSSQLSQSKAYSSAYSSEQSQSKKWRLGRRGAGDVVWTLVAVLTFVSSVGDAMPRRSVGPRAPEQDNKLMGYLESFGYLPEVKGGPGSLRSADQLKDALRNLQAFAGLPATGQLDVETQQLLQRPRCGLPDISLQHARRKRRKRYAVQGQKWHTLNITWR